MPGQGESARRYQLVVFLNFYPVRPHIADIDFGPKVPGSPQDYAAREAAAPQLAGFSGGGGGIYIGTGALVVALLVVVVILLVR